MAELIQGFTVTASNASKKGSQMASVSVKAPTGMLVARIHSERSQPLRWLRKWPHSIEAAQLKAQLTQAGVPQGIVEEIVSLKKGK